MENTAVYLTAVFLILTKAADVATTWHGLHDCRFETNPLARKLMEKKGIAWCLTAGSILSLLIIFLSGYAAVSGGILYKTLYTVLGMFIAYTQAEVARCNYYRKRSRTIELILWWHRLFEKIIKGGH